MTTTIYDFAAQNKRGSLGERFIVDYLYDELYEENVVIDKIPFDPNNRHNADIYLKKNKKITLEIKTDSFTTGNFFLETCSNLELKTAGCIQASRSDFLIYYFSNKKEIYIFKTKDLKNWLSRNKVCFPVINVPNKTHTTQGVIIPIQELINDISVFGVKDLLKAVE